SGHLIRFAGRDSNLVELRLVVTILEPAKRDCIPRIFTGLNATGGRVRRVLHLREPALSATTILCEGPRDKLAGLFGRLVSVEHQHRPGSNCEDYERGGRELGITEKKP